MLLREFQEGAVDGVTNEIVRAVAAETGRDPLSLPPLYRSVDPDGLARLVDHGSRTDGRDVDVTVTFEYARCTVVVSTVGGVDVVVRPD